MTATLEITSVLPWKQQQEEHRSLRPLIVSVLLLLRSALTVHLSHTHNRVALLGPLLVAASTRPPPAPMPAIKG
ncbi:hypothetical protein BHE74_00041013 [Ensete ventricosum]|nr:hypothetical protein GW17_00034337 [Ensete ventricosum]RWW52553.1 hypothetical protein BHE74_00041013 [Ensete ventricosum]